MFTLHESSVAWCIYYPERMVLYGFATLGDEVAKRTEKVCL